jgi:hypothetical protein
MAATVAPAAAVTPAATVIAATMAMAPAAAVAATVMTAAAAPAIVTPAIMTPAATAPAKAAAATPAESCEMGDPEQRGTARRTAMFHGACRSGGSWPVMRKRRCRADQDRRGGERRQFAVSMSLFHGKLLMLEVRPMYPEPVFLSALTRTDNRPENRGGVYANNSSGCFFRSPSAVLRIL